MATTVYSEIMRLAPLRYYSLADAVSSATVKDYSGNGQDGTVNGGVTFGQSPLLKASTLTSVLFNGSNGYVDCPTTGLPTGAQPWTVLCYLSFASVPGGGNYPAVLGFGNGANGSDVAPFFNGDTGKMALGFTGLTDINSSIPVVANHIYFIAGTYDGATGIFYCYDQTAGTSDITSHAEALNLAYGAMHIGTNVSGSLWSPAKQGQCALLGTALTADQIAWLYKVGQGAGVLQGNHRAFGRIR